jgi:AraC family transcriptional regulator of adaptative response/methylated-DNA-[protein]-cysteine methyltransferase
MRLGDSDAELEAKLLSEYSSAAVVRDDDVLNGWVEQLLRHLKGKQPHLDLPLDVQATAFQWSVWEKLREIPYGTTQSYGDVARAMGRPTATRAVARACATNPVALVIPCHRVVREDKSLGGYRWGINANKRCWARNRHQINDASALLGVLCAMRRRIDRSGKVACPRSFVFDR